MISSKTIRGTNPSTLRDREGIQTVSGQHVSSTHRGNVLNINGVSDCTNNSNDFRNCQYNHKGDVSTRYTRGITIFIQKYKERNIKLPSNMDNYFSLVRLILNNISVDDIFIFKDVTFVESVEMIEHSGDKKTAQRSLNHTVQVCRDLHNLIIKNDTNHSKHNKEVLKFLTIYSTKLKEIFQHNTKSNTRNSNTRNSNTRNSNTRNSNTRNSNTRNSNTRNSNTRNSNIITNCANSTNITSTITSNNRNRVVNDEEVNNSTTNSVTNSVTKSLPPPMENWEDYSSDDEEVNNSTTNSVTNSTTKSFPSSMENWEDYSSDDEEVNNSTTNSVTNSTTKSFPSSMENWEDYSSDEEKIL